MRVALAVLATWRVTHLLAREDGPGDVIVRMRSRLGDSTLGELMDCFDCLSLWVAAPASLLVARTAPDRALTWLALSGAACLLERASREPVIIQPLPEFTTGDAHDVMLRTEARPHSNGADASAHPNWDFGPAPTPPGE
jgi:hypothetical protein